MPADRGIDRAIGQYLAAGPVVVPHRVVDAAVHHAVTHPRSRRSGLGALRLRAADGLAFERPTWRIGFAVSWAIFLIVLLVLGMLLAIGLGSRFWSPSRSWDQIETPMLLTAVAQGPGGFVGLGQRGYGQYAFASRDGLTWSQSSIDGLADALAATTMGYVVVGHLWTTDDQEINYARPVAWVSLDGATWARGAIPLEGANVGAVWSLVVRDGQLIAYGHQGEAPDEGRGGVAWAGGREVAWSSRDGVTWHVVREYAGGGPSDLVRGGPGFVGVRDGMLVTSSDAIRWQAIETGPGSALSVTCLATNPAGTIVAAGATGFAWSTDGVAWSIADGLDRRSDVEPDPGAIGPSRTRLQVSDVTWTGAGFVAVGNQFSVSDAGLESETSQPRVWSSPDGRTWAREVFDFPSAAELRFVNTVGSTLLVSGFGSSAEGTYLLWSTVDLAPAG